MQTVYGLVIGIPEQHELINRHCLGDCAKALMAGIDDVVIGPMICCEMPKGQCPHFAAEMDEPLGLAFDRFPLILRKLAV